MRIATWNIERLRHKKFLEQILLACEQTQADILVLTETDHRVRLDYPYSFHTPPLTDLQPVFRNCDTAMFNPEIIKKSGPYEAEEGCLSLTGTRKAKRWQSIKVQYQNEQFQTRFKTFTGWTAQIIQHEIDHCEGVRI